MIKKVLIDQKGNRIFWEKGDVNTLLGVIKEDQIKEGIIYSHRDKPFVCFPASFVDATATLIRGPATMADKEIATIITRTGINHESNVVEAGAGSGKLTAYLAHLTPHVFSYEKQEDNVRLAEKNLKKLNLAATVKRKDIGEGIDEKDVDVVIYDLLNPWDYLPQAHQALKQGGFLVCYITNVRQLSHLLQDYKRDQFVVDSVLETIEREWIPDAEMLRPRNQGLLHTGFLVFFRRI